MTTTCWIPSGSSATRESPIWYNGGGHVISAKMLATCIAGEKCDGEVFQYYRYNDSRMADPAKTQKQTGNTYDREKALFYENFSYGDYYGADLKQYALGLQNIYVLTTGSTASSSEAVINGLRGIDIGVTLIGEKTNGKNVGMEIDKFDDATIRTSWPRSRSKATTPKRRR